MAVSSIVCVGASHNPGTLPAIDPDKLAHCTGAVTMAVDSLNQFHGEADGMRHIIGGLMLAREGLLELRDSVMQPEAATHVTKDEAPASDATDEPAASRAELESAVETMDRHSQETFHEIEAIAVVAAAALDQAHTRQVRTHLRTLLDAIAYKALDTMNEINCAAEGVGFQAARQPTLQRRFDHG